MWIPDNSLQSRYKKYPKIVLAHQSWSNNRWDRQYNLVSNGQEAFHKPALCCPKGVIMVNLMYVVDDLKQGGPVIFRTVLKHLDKKKYHISVCCLFGGGELVSEIESYGIKVFILGFRKWKPWLIFKLVLLMKQLNIQVVHTHLFASNMIGRIAAYLASIPVIIATMRNTTQIMTKTQMIIDRILEPITTNIVVIDRAVKDSVIRDEKIPSSKIICIHNAIDMTEFTSNKIDAMPQRAELKVSQNKFLIGMIAGLSPIKGYFYLLEAMPILLKEIPGAQLVLIGDGPLRKEIEKEIFNLDITENVALLGSRQDIPALTSLFDILVHPCLIEGVPKSVLESMAMKKAVVATTLSSYPDVIVNGITAVLVPPKDPTALAQAIVKLYRKPQIRASIGQNAYEVVKDYFNYPRMIKELEHLYDSLCK